MITQLFSNIFTKYQKKTKGVKITALISMVNTRWSYSKNVTRKSFGGPFDPQKENFITSKPLRIFQPNAKGHMYITYIYI